MTIKTTRLKATQTPRIRTMDLSDQLNGSRQTFSLPRRIQTWDTHYLVWNSTVYRNDRNHRFYSISEDGYSLTTYFDQAPQGGAGRTLQLAYSSGGDGEDDVLTKAEVNKLVNDEAEARRAADEALGVRIDEEAEARRAADAQERAERVAADEAEKAAREAGDNNLQAQLDATAAASDVVDIVNTKAELDAYNKSALTDKDVIKVLNDETQNGATTYYRYDKPANQFNLIGSVGPYYTQSEVNNITNNITNNMNANLQHCIKDNVSTEQTMIGDLRLKKNGSNFDTKLSFGDGDYTSIYEYEDDKLRIKGNTINLATSTSTLMIGTSNPVSLASLLDNAGGGIDYIHYENPIRSGPVELRIGEKSKSDFLKLYIGNRPMATALKSGSDSFLYMRAGSVAMGTIKIPVSTSQFENTYTNGDNVMIGSQLEAVTSGIAGYVNIGMGNKSGEEAILVGRGWTGAKEAVALGYNIYNKTIAELSVSIGHGAGATTVNSVALGAFSSTSRADEVSIGGDYYWSGNKHIDRYIANVKAGVNDTDAVNVKQMKDYVAEHAGGSSTTDSRLTDDGATKANNLPDHVLKEFNPIETAEDGALRLSISGVNLDGSGSMATTSTIPLATTSRAGLISSSDKQKLSRIPQTVVSASGIKQTSDDKKTSLLVKYKNVLTGEAYDDVVEIPTVSSQYNGLMTVENKSKLDRIPAMIIGSTAEGGDPMFAVDSVDAGLSLAYNQYFTGTDANRLPTTVIFPTATATTNGVMSAADKAKLDSLASGDVVREGFATLSAATGDLQLLNILPDNWRTAKFEIIYFPDNLSGSIDTTLKLNDGTVVVNTNADINMTGAGTGDGGMKFVSKTLTLAKYRKADGSDVIGFIDKEEQLTAATTTHEKLNGGMVTGGNTVNGITIPYAVSNVSYKITVVTGD